MRDDNARITSAAPGHSAARPLLQVAVTEGATRYQSPVCANCWSN